LHPRREAILKFLSVERGMSAQQLAKAIPFSQGERKETPISITPKRTDGKTKTYQYPGTYQLTIQMLNRLKKEGIVKQTKEVSAREGKVNVNASYIWSVVADADFEKQGYSKDKRIPIDPDNKDHELDCADFLVALVEAIYPNLDRLSHWDYSWTKEERDTFHIDGANGYGVNYDRHFILDGKEYFLEVDRGTKNPEYVYEQLKRYKRFLAEKSRGATLLVTAQRYRFKTDQDKAAEIWNMVRRLGVPSRQMLVCIHSLALQNPLAPVWKCPPDPKLSYTPNGA
jgi:hypothetical protein